MPHVGYLRLILAVSLSLLPSSLGITCQKCAGDQCVSKDLSDSCEGDYCFIQSYFSSTGRTFKGCLSGDSPESIGKPSCSVVTEVTGDVIPLYCQCDAPGCNADTGKSDRPSDPLLECRCTGDHCERSGVCHGRFCWEVTGLSEPHHDQRSLQGCSDTLGLIDGVSCMQPPVLGIYELTVLEMDRARACFCNNEAYCNVDNAIFDEAQIPNGRLTTKLELGSMAQSGTADVYLIQGFPDMMNVTFEGGDGYVLEIEYSGFSDADRKKFRIEEKPETTTQGPDDDVTTVLQELDITGANKPTAGKLGTQADADYDDEEKDGQDEGSSNTAIIAIFVTMMVVIVVAGLAWKCGLHRKIFAARYQSVA